MGVGDCLYADLCASRGSSRGRWLPRCGGYCSRWVALYRAGLLEPYPSRTTTLTLSNCMPPRPTCCRREAEQRARAARLYDRQRQRFQRALLAAEDLEGADSSVFSAVSRKGSVAAPGSTAGPASAAGAAGAAAAAAAGGAAGTGAAVLPPAAEAAVAEFVGPVHSMASIDADDDG